MQFDYFITFWQRGENKFPQLSTVQGFGATLSVLWGTE